MSDSREVAGQIDGMNRKNIPQKTASMLREANAFTLYVFNAGPDSFVREVGVGTYYVKGKEKGQRYSEPVIIPATIHTTVVGETGMRWEASEGWDVAKDIVQIGKPADYTRHGLFISESAVPSEEEIAAAEEARVEYLGNLVQDADEHYQVNGGAATVSINGVNVTRNNIQDIHRKALRELGWTRPWATKNIQMAECWNCGRAVMPTSAKCFHEGCGAPLKNEEAKARFIAGDEEVEVRRGPGRPAKVG
jgi:hypothetical protein